MPEKNLQPCRICGSPTFRKWRSSLLQPPNSRSFAITDLNYGRISALYQCGTCGFRQCHDLSDVLSFYQSQADPAYEDGRKQRKRQARALLKRLGRFKRKGRLLDVGAGSGILVEAAREEGFQAHGVEPSRWLQGRAEKRGLPVRAGLLEHTKTEPVWDAITLVDVIEHVEDPVGMLKEMEKRLTCNGVAMIVTPDVKSFFARLLGRKWWHYRVAHIGYFDASTLELACGKAGLRVVHKSRPDWYFTVDYLWVRIMQYFPGWLRIQPCRLMRRWTVRINLRDSLLAVVQKKEGTCASR